jgi:hypothetical protein
MIQIIIFNTRKFMTKETSVAVQPQELSLIEQVVIKGDLSKLTDVERVSYYKSVCDSIGLNPLTKPFDYINLNGKLTLYAKRECTEQLRKIHGVAIVDLQSKVVDDVYIVSAKARDKTGRTDESTGAVNIANLRGEMKANAIMKAETKAKRRVTLSICGLGWCDETEVETIPGAVIVPVNLETGEITIPAEDMSQKQLPPSENPCVDNGKGPKISTHQLQEINHLEAQVDAQCRDNFKAYLLREFQVIDYKDIPLAALGGCMRSLWSNIENNKKQQVPV